MTTTHWLGAYHGEFGLKLRFWVPQVAAVCRAMPGPVGVSHEAGEEALFPWAGDREEVHVQMTHRERARLGRPRNLRAGMEWFLPEPWITQGTMAPDVVVGPRWSDYGKSKNWDAWPDLCAALGEKAHLDVFAVGTAAGSYGVAAQGRSWEYLRVLDASIEAMRKASLAVVTDSGVAHLAVLCGTPMVLVTYRGRVAPGPVVDSRGRVAHDQYWPVRWEEYYKAANHMGAPMWSVAGWEHWERVLEYAVGVLPMARDWKNRQPPGAAGLNGAMFE